jgi:rRNA maturation endonuclease Nob1
MPKCSFCNSYREIVWEDYAQKQEYLNAIYVAMCYKCFKEFGIMKDVTAGEIAVMEENPQQHPEYQFLLALRRIENLFPKMLICSGCQEKFIPNKSTQTICYDCYSKTKPVQMQVKAWRFE